LIAAVFLAFNLHASITSLGINLMDAEIIKERSIKSSRYPSTGIKSGMISMGLKA
jgi:hypothetical protein